MEDRIKKMAKNPAAYAHIDAEKMEAEKSKEQKAI